MDLSYYLVSFHSEGLTVERGAGRWGTDLLAMGIIWECLLFSSFLKDNFAEYILVGGFVLFCFSIQHFVKSLYPAVLDFYEELNTSLWLLSGFFVFF